MADVWPEPISDEEAPSTTDFRGMTRWRGFDGQLAIAEAALEVRHRADAQAHASLVARGFRSRVQP